MEYYNSIMSTCGKFINSVKQNNDGNSYKIKKCVFRFDYANNV